MSLPDAIQAIRAGVALERGPDVAIIGVRGDDARDVLLHTLPSRLYLRDAQVRESLFLDDAGRPIADVLVCADDEDYFLLVEGLDAAAAVSHLEAHVPDGLSPEIVDMSAAHGVVSLHGPWAWEPLAHVLGADMIALPYLNFFRIDHGWCVRAGKTGEYGYDIVVKRDEMDALAGRLIEDGTEWRVTEVAPADVSVCRFENWFFDPRHVPAGVTPLELQLQWRLDTSRRWVGREAVDARRAEGVARRLTCLVCPDALAAGDAVKLSGAVVGEVTRAQRSPVREEHIAAALVDVAWAYGGIDAFEVEHAGESVRAASVAPPLVDNRSLYVDPRRHSFREVDEIEFGPLTRGARAPA